MRLNQFIAHAGISSRRRADQLIAAGQIRVNGVVIQRAGVQVGAQDQVHYQGKLLKLEQKIYLLFHKPMNCITTLDDPQGRKTVRDYFPRHQFPRIYPVGRLDRNTSGLLLLTNDGKLARGLSHPSTGIPKTYQVTLKKPLLPTPFKAIRGGIHLEDGKADVDAIRPLDASRLHWELQLHSGKNRIIRRIFAALAYPIKKLERTQYAQLTLDGLGQGKHRRLSDQEVAQLQAALLPEK